MSAKQANHKQTFSIKAPMAMSVMLAGDFTHWAKNPLPLKRDAQGIWTVSTALSPGRHHYRFIIDGEWCDDPDCKLRVPNPFGSQNALIHVPAFPPRARVAGGPQSALRHP